MKMNLVEKPISLKMDSFYLFPFEITKEDIQIMNSRKILRDFYEILKANMSKIK